MMSSSVDSLEKLSEDAGDLSALSSPPRNAPAAVDHVVVKRDASQEGRWRPNKTDPAEGQA